MSGNMWYFAENNQQQGPISEDELYLLFASSRLPLETLVWSQGLANWTPAGQIAAFARASLPAPHAVATETPPPAVTSQYGTSAQAEATGLRDIIRENKQDQSHQQTAFQQIYASYSSAVEEQSTSHQESAPGNGGSKWGDLDAIGRSSTQAPQQQHAASSTPATSHHGQTENKWGDLDSVGRDTNAVHHSNQNSEAQSGASKWGDLDSIGRSSAQQNHHLANNTAAQSQNSWGNLDAIGTPAAATQPENNWGNLDALGTPAATTPTANSWGNLDAIGQPAAQTAYQQSGSYGNLDAIGQPAAQTAHQQSGSYGNLDAIGQPAAQTAQQQSGSYGNLDAIGRETPAPASSSAPKPAAGLASKWGDLDSIGTRSKFTAPTAETERPELKPHVVREGATSQTLKKLRVETAPDVPPAGKFKEAKVAYAGAVTGLSVEKNAIWLEPRPWARFGARWIDSIVYSFGLIIPVGLMMAFAGVSVTALTAEGGELPPAAAIPMMVALAIGMLLYLLIEPILLCTWGTTVGKAVFGIRLRDAQTGGKLSFVKATWRTFLFWLYTGQLLGLIPVIGGPITLGCYWWQYSRLNNAKITSYDEIADVLYEHTRNT